MQNWGSEHLHGFQHERQMIHKRGHGHSEDPGFISTPPPETQRRLGSEYDTTHFDILIIFQQSLLHRQRAAGHRELFADAAFPRLPVRGERAQSNDGLLRGRKGNVQGTVHEVKEDRDGTSAYLWTTKNNY